MRARGALVLNAVAAVAHGAALLWYTSFLRTEVGAGFADVVDVLGLAAKGLLGTAAALALLALAARRPAVQRVALGAFALELLIQAPWGLIMTVDVLEGSDAIGQPPGLLAATVTVTAVALVGASANGVLACRPVRTGHRWFTGRPQLAHRSGVDSDS